VCTPRNIPCTFEAERQGTRFWTFSIRKMDSWGNSLAVCGRTHSQTHPDGFRRSSRCRGSILNGPERWKCGQATKDYITLYQCLDNGFQRTGLVENATPTSRGPPEAVGMSLGVCPGANSKIISSRIHFSGPERPETRSLPLSFKSTCYDTGCAHIYESA